MSRNKSVQGKMLNALRLMRDLMQESEGVTGYHGNGKVMAWGEWEDLNPETLNELIDEVEWNLEEESA